MSSKLFKKKYFLYPFVGAILEWTIINSKQIGGKNLANSYLSILKSWVR